MLSGNAWANTVAGRVTVAAAFLEQLPSYYATVEYPNFAPLNASQRDAAIRAVRAWTDVANIAINFESRSPSQYAADNLLLFGTAGLPASSAAHAYYPGRYFAAGDVWLNANVPSNQVQSDGSYGYMTMIHEIGHALGLSHPADYNAGGFVPTGPTHARDTRQFTLMSYFRHADRGAEASTPLLDDIAAAQFLYGANMTTRTGNDTYQLAADENRVFAIWDAGGIDTLDASAQTRRSILNLNEGAYSSIGANGQGAAANNNVAIAFNAVIENARGGAGSDTLFSNPADNRLEGGGGADRYVFATGWGADTIVDATSGDVVEFAGVGSTGLDTAREGRNLILSRRGSTDRVTINNYFAAATGQANLNWRFTANGQDFTLPNVTAGTDGHSIDTAADLGPLVTTASTPGSITNADRFHFYRFALGSDANVELRLVSVGLLRANVDVELLNSAGEVIATSRNAGTAPETLTQFLDAGIYFVRVFAPGSGETLFDLNLTARTAVRPNTDDNTLATANDLGDLNNRNSAIVNDFVGRADTVDFYRFTLAADTSVIISLLGREANAAMQLLDGQGRPIAASRRVDSEEQIERALVAGQYAIRVSSVGGADTNYRLAVLATTIADAVPNTRDAARNIGILDARPQVFTDAVGGLDPADFYRFTLAATANFNLTLSGLSANADVQIQDSQGRVIASSVRSGTADDTIARSLVAGDYFVRIFPVGTAETDYRLTLSAAPVGSVEGDDTRDQARNVGPLDNRERTFNDYVSARIDPNDFYRFTLAAAANFNLTLNGLAADADVQLQDSLGRVIASSVRSGTTDDTIARSLAAGDYFVRVFAFGTAETNYRLTLSAGLIAVDNAGNTRDTARNIGPLDDRARTFNDYVSGALDANDFYRFTLAAAANLSLTLSGLTADADVQLQDRLGR
ncbi:MAG: pre-peptidase C-terminal domain-containing protein, partial [Pseudomonadota bacterium]